MEACIYCNRDDKVTESHIIPNALSNGTMKNYYVCPKHNNSFSDAFETKIINGLGIIANRLDIISTNGNDYPRYTIEYEWDGKTFIDNKHTSINGWIDKILESTDRTMKIGPKNKVHTEKIVAIDFADANLKINFPINLEIFNSYEMKRLIAKIAYEWFCSFNKITTMPEFLYELREFILGESTNDVVEVINDLKIKNAFNGMGGDYSHKLLTFINSNNKYCVIIAFWDIVYYAVEICLVSSFPEGKELFYREQVLDSSHIPYVKQTQKEFEFEFGDSLKNLYYSKDIFEEKILSNSVKITALNPSIQLNETSFKINLMMLLNICKNYICGQKEGFEGYYQILKNEIDEIIRSSVVTPRKLRRIADAIKFQDNLVDMSALSIMQLPIIYLIYKLGKNPPQKLTDINFKEFTKKHLSTILNEKVADELTKEMVEDSHWIFYLEQGTKYLKQI